MADILHAHRFSYRKPDWRAGIWAGLIAGLAFLVLEMALVPLLMNGNLWEPPRMIAAILMGRYVLPPPATFDAVIMASALLVHFTLSVVFGLILAAIIAFFNLDSSTGLVLAVGAIFGIAIYLINFYGMTALFPWFAEARNWLTFTLHAIFGVVAAESYFALEKRERLST